LSEVVPPKRNELHDALERKDGDEDDVDVVQDVGKTLRLVVMLHRHRHHVEQDYDHDSNVKLLVRYQLEEDHLTLQLRVVKMDNAT